MLCVPPPSPPPKKNLLELDIRKNCFLVGFPVACPGKSGEQRPGSLTHLWLSPSVFPLLRSVAAWSAAGMT